MQGKPVLSSVPLQIFLTLNAYYFALLFILEILLFVYKAEILPYPAGNLALDLVLFFILVGIEIARLFIASKGNLTEHTFSAGFSVFLFIPSALLVVYLIVWQVYVLRADIVLCGILLSLQGVELIFTLISLCTFSRSSAW